MAPKGCFLGGINYKRIRQNWKWAAMCWFAFYLEAIKRREEGQP